MGKVTVIPSKINPLTHMPKNEIQKRRVAAYARVSTLQEEQANSYEAQIDYYTKYIGARPDWQFVGMYSDKGITGTNRKKRVGFNQMIEDAFAGKIDLIITKAVTRFARNTLDTISLTRELKSKGVEVFFEEQNVYTFDSSGELMLTILASMGQEESRNISENVKWGKRKKYKDGQVSLGYKNFLGYDKHPDEKIALKVNEEQAKIVRLIYRLFMEGKTTSYIAKYLDEQGIKTPMGKDNWRVSTIESMLRNEKYKGDALVQKKYVKDFLSHELVENNGELEQYYQENHHEPIINPEEWQIVQAELERRKSIQYSCMHKFSSKLICADCGSFFGPKIWHSTDKYRKVVYRCNRKFDKDHAKCQTPTLTDEDIVPMFLKAYNEFMGDRAQTIEDCKMMVELLDNTEDLEEEIKTLQNKANDIVVLVENLISTNSKVAMSQDEYQQKYDAYDLEYKHITEKIQKDEKEIATKKAKSKLMTAFIDDLKTRPTVLEEWSDDVWNYMMDIAKVHRDGSITFTFKTGKEITVK